MAYERNKTRWQNRAAEAMQSIGGTLEEFSTRLPQRSGWQRFLLGDNRPTAITNRAADTKPTESTTDSGEPVSTAT